MKQLEIILSPGVGRREGAKENETGDTCLILVILVLLVILVIPVILVILA